MAVRADWSTASIGDAADTSPAELSELGEHLGHCRRWSGRLFTLQCRAQRLHAFVAGRIVTTLVVVGLLYAAAWLLS